MKNQVCSALVAPKNVACAVALAVSSVIAPASAQDADAYVYEPMDFTETVNLARGSIAPLGDGGFHLNDKDACHLVTTEWGWERAGCASIDKIIFGLTENVDSVIIDKPNSDGYISYEEWESGDRDKQIREMWNSFRDGVKAQGDELGVTITLNDWLVKPTLNKEANYLYYATDMTWDGDRTVNVDAMVFDRRGYVNVSIVPMSEDFTASDVEGLIQETLAAYAPRENETYADFTDGDKVASVGVLGVLAGALGVKYGKVLAGGLVAVLIALAKKFWFVLLLPLVALRNFFGKKDTE